MSRLTLCVITAGALALASLGIMVVRYHVLGSAIASPSGPGTYHVTLVARGKMAGEAKLTTVCALDFDRQHIFREELASNELHRRPMDTHHPERHLAHWTSLGNANASFAVRYEFYCQVSGRPPTSARAALGRKLYEAPSPGEYLQSDARIEAGDPAITELALDLTRGLTAPADQARALYQHVSDEIVNEPGAGGPSAGAMECLKAGRGDATAKSRLLAALCRNRGIPTRLVSGLLLNRAGEQRGHVWVEAWVGERWVSYCPFHHHVGHVPPTYLVLAFDDQPLVRGHNIRGLSYAFLAEHRPPPEADADQQPSLVYRLFDRISLYNLPATEMELVELLLLLPIAALIICLFRNLIGVQTFGTFAPALIGLAFRHTGSFVSPGVFIALILVGWGIRRVLDRYRLLQVPRTAFLLSTVVVVLLIAIMAATFCRVTPTSVISLFPLIILTGMIERFWTLETEDGTMASFKTLAGTIAIAAIISFVVSRRVLVDHLVRYPETLGLVMACQLLLGRYTGYRLSELFRFRDLIRGREQSADVHFEQVQATVPFVRQMKAWRQ
jgi:hypothetical protein